MSTALPETGFVRLPTILHVFPVSRSAWWQGVKDGRYPAAVKLSPRCTAWKAEEIRAFLIKMAAQGAQTKKPAA